MADSGADRRGEDEILSALRRIMRAHDMRSRMLLQGYGLTAPQLTTLLAIARLEPVTAGVVAREVHLGHSTITGILDRLERRGWIGRRRGELDRRSVNLCLTEAGRRVLESAPSLMDDRFRQRLGELAQWERTQILATLQRIADMMDLHTMGLAPAMRTETTDRAAADDSRRAVVPQGADSERERAGGLVTGLGPRESGKEEVFRADERRREA
jgi:DNA-binding MarR family transcriptional regulator